MLRVKVSQWVTITAPVATRKQRVSLGNAVIAGVTKRIQDAKDVRDANAKPLSTNRAIVVRGHDRWSYAVVKSTTLHRRALRDWTVSGALLASLRVSVATKTRIVISPTGDHRAAGGSISNQSLMAKQQGLCEMFGISPSDEAEIQKMVNDLAAYLSKNMLVPSSAFLAGGYTSSRVGGEFL